MKYLTKYLLCGGAMTAFYIPMAAIAQDQASQGGAVQTYEPSAGEIVVTAQKRTESLRDVGLTVQAFSGDALQRQGIASVEDLTKVVPGLTYTSGHLSNPVYTLRGVGFYDASLAAYPAVTVYIDQVPLIFPALTTQVGLDLERVEVLKGPQGTLFGQNSTGGAINYVAAKPTGDFHAGFNLEYGRFNSIIGEGFVSGPLTENLKARAAIKLSDRGSWQRGYTADIKNGRVRSFAGRLLLDWTPIDSVRFNLNLNAWSNGSDPQAAQFYEAVPQSPIAPEILVQYPTAPKNARAADFSKDYNPKYDQRVKHAALNSEFDLTNNLTLTSITSYLDYDQDNRLDPDGMTLEAYHIASDIGDIQTFTQEVRIANSDSGPARYVVGATYENSDVLQRTIEKYGDSTVFPSYGFKTNGYFGHQKMENYAVFGNIDYDINRFIKLKAGIRYTKNKTKFEGCAHDAGDGLAAAFFTATAEALRGSPITPLDPGDCFQLDANFLPDHVFEDQLKEDNVSWRVGVDVKPSDSILFYANVSKGYKNGGFVQVSASSDSQYTPVTQESVVAYEAGFKLEALNNRLFLSGAGFYYDYEDKQLRGKVIDPIFGLLDRLLNVPKSELKGAELNIQWRPIDGLNASAAATHVKGEVKEFTGVAVGGGLLDYAGSPIPLSPKFQMSGALDYDFSISSGANAFLGGNVSYNSSTYGVIGGNIVPTTQFPDPGNRIKGYFLLDLRAGVRSADDRLSFSIWGKNVTNSYYWINAMQIYDQKVRFTGMPRTYGVSLGFKY